MPFISVIVPVYNVEEYLDRCCHSIVNQTYRDIEIILVDDGSKDKSGVLCEKWKERDQRIRCIHKKNEGVSAARNDGIALAAGEYITFVDADDWIELDAYEKISKELIEKKPDILKFGYKKIQNEKVTGIYVPMQEEKVLYDRTAIEQQILLDSIQLKPLFSEKTFILSACMQVFKRSLIIENKIKFLKVLNEDPLFSVEAIAKAHSYVTLKSAFYNYDTRTGSATMQYIRNMYQGKMDMYQHYQKVITENHLDEKAKSRLDLYFINCVYACINNECRKISKRNMTQAVKEIRRIFKCSNVKHVIRHTDCGENSKKGKVLLFMLKHEMAFSILCAYRTFIRK